VGKKEISRILGKIRYACIENKNDMRSEKKASELRQLSDGKCGFDGEVSDWMMTEESAIKQEMKKMAEESAIKEEMKMMKVPWVGL